MLVKNPGFTAGRRAHAGAGHRRQHRAVLGGQWRAAEPAAVSATRRVGDAAREQAELSRADRFRIPTSATGRETTTRSPRWRSGAQLRFQPDGHRRGRTGERRVHLLGFLSGAGREADASAACSPRKKTRSAPAPVALISEGFWKRKFEFRAGHPGQEHHARRQGLHHRRRHPREFPLCRFRASAQSDVYVPIGQWSNPLLHATRRWPGNPRHRPAQAGRDDRAGARRHGASHAQSRGGLSGRGQRHQRKSRCRSRSRWSAMSGRSCCWCFWPRSASFF